MENYRLLSRIALSFASSGNLDSQMGEALADIGNAFMIARAYVFLDNADGLTFGEAFEWRAAGIPSLEDECRGLAHADAPALREALQKRTFIQAAQGEGLLEELKRDAGPSPVLSLAAYPIYLDQGIRGFIGLDECGRKRAWSETELNFLKTLAGIMSAALERKGRHDALAASERNFKTLFDTIDDLVIISGQDGNILFTNRAVTEKLGYSAEELSSMAVFDLPPPAKREEARAALEAMFRRERNDGSFEFIGKKGQILPVETRAWFGTWNGRDCVFGFSKDLSNEREALQKFTKLFENNPAIMAISQASDRRFVDVNLAFLDKLGYRREEVIGKTSANLGIFHDKDEWRLAGDELMSSGRIKNRQLKVRRKDGSDLTGLFSGEIIESRGEMFFLTVMVDVSELVELQAQVEDQRARLENVINGTRLGIWEWNVQSGATVFNERWAEIAGFRLSELEPVSIETWKRLAHPEDALESDRLLEAHFRGESEFYECEIRVRHKDGHWIWVLDRGKVTEWDEEGRPLMMFGTHADVTEKKALEDKVRELSLHDPLTGAYNRRFLMGRLDDLLAEYCRAGRMFALAMLDIDFFKAINDECGHLAGDFVLRELSRLLGEGLRPYDFLCRYGGEEFIIVLLNIERKTASSVVERMLKRLRGSVFDFADKEIRFTVSAGVADAGEFPRDGTSTDGLIELADRRLYRAKRDGRDRIEFSGD
jgi:diguanylate cyclase (GGDEF)-like protein/PAS domain S-box-containing protein